MLRKLSYIFLFTVASCVKAPAPVTDSMLQEFTKGVTTYSEVVSRLGTPDNEASTPSADGKIKMIMYSRKTSKDDDDNKGVSILSSALIGQRVREVTTTTVGIRFDKNDKFVEYTKNVNRMKGFMGGESPFHF